MLWRSPEHLRSVDKAPTKEGDIYAVGIIMQEVITREEPFYAERNVNNMDIKGETRTTKLNLNVMRACLVYGMRFFVWDGHCSAPH